MISTHDYISDYLRLLEVKGVGLNEPIIVHSNHFLQELPDSLSYRINPWGDQLKQYEYVQGEGLNFTLLSPQFNSNYNTKYARSFNDGPAWYGKGVSFDVNAGFRVDLGPVSGIFYPNFSFSENRPFQLFENGIGNEFRYQLDPRIDWVQRFGNSSFKQFHLGQSSLFADLWKIRIKVSTENMWWGPGISNSITMSNTAPGFLHASIGTYKPIVTSYGDFEFNSIWGRFRESEYFDGISDNDNRFLHVLSFGYRPSFSKLFKGLSFGLTRVIYQTWPTSGLSFGDLFLGLKNTNSIPQVDSNGNLVFDETDQILSFNFRWIFAKAASEIYFDFGRSDFWLDFKDLVSEPDHSGVYTIGFQKAFTSKNGTWRLSFEHTSLAAARTREIRSSLSIYLNSAVTQGYTNRGQLLGAGIGPGSKAQTLRLDKFDSNGKLGLVLSRIKFNEDYVFDQSTNTQTTLNHDVEVNFGAEYVRFFDSFELATQLIFSRRINWYYQDGDVSNVQLTNTIRWHF